MELRFPLILDGATGTELQKRGYTGDVCAEQWTLDHPDAIIDIQRGYVAAGSQVVYTPTFGANRRKLEESGLFNCTADYNRRLAELSAQAVQGKALRAGDMSPTGAFLAPLGDVSFEELVDIYVRFSDESEKEPSLNDQARAAFAELERGNEEYLAIWRYFKEISLREYMKTYELLGIEFDSFDGESFFTDKMPAIVEELREKGLLVQDDGAWIVDLAPYGMPPALILKLPL